jgi:hypothetical protein
VNWAGDVTTVDTAIARLAVEYWRLLRLIERAVSAAPEHLRERLEAQAGHAIFRFETILKEQKMSIQEFDGMDFEVNLPASPINATDFPGDTRLVVERTIEPAIVCDMRVVLTGKVLLARKS